MAYAEDFVAVKQFDKLYKSCMAAGECYENGSPKEGYTHVCEAFDEMLELTAEKNNYTIDELYSSDLMTDLSFVNYDMYAGQLEDKPEDDAWKFLRDADSESFATDPKVTNAFYALQEEVNKFAHYYVRGARPSSIGEIASEASDGHFMSRDTRNFSDLAFGIMAAGTALTVGAILLIVALIKSNTELIVGGISFLVLAVLLLALRSVKK